MCLRHMFFADLGAVQSIRNETKCEMKIEPVLILFMQNITSSNMADQNDYLIATESYKSFSVFLKFRMDGKWSECMNVTKLKRKGRAKLNLSSGPLIVLLWLLLQVFSRHS